ncbi:hypothetical protein [Alkalihalobacillus sp. AL-G]|nr:hypothetical protein [Alkalihalobacillus sp. AL-G]WLD94289.1 hypothetical protein MOJ78_05185 [Alkalihalobacillus sp. AL-G]
MEKLLQFEKSKYGVEKDGLIVAPSIFKVFKIVFRTNKENTKSRNISS